MSTNKIIYGVSKYKNITGVTCYMNSILHILQQLPYFTSYIYNKLFEYNIQNNDNIPQLVIYQLYKLFKLSLDHDNVTIVPNAFKSNIGSKDPVWNEQNQQDSHEFLMFLLLHMQQEINIKYTLIYGNDNFSKNLILSDSTHLNLNYNDSNLNLNDCSLNIHNIIACNMDHEYNKKEFSILSILFNGLLKMTSKCAYCKTKSYMYEPYTILELPIPNDSTTLYECLDEFIKIEQLDNYNMLTCDFCGLKNKSHKQTLLWNIPKILILHLKRFSNYNSINQTESFKLINNINYPIYNLNLSKYLHSNSPYKKNCLYNLVGINIHKSLGNIRSLNNGHYVSIIKNIFNNKWYLYNDDNPVVELDKDELQDSNAYLLFYYHSDN